MSAKGKFTEWLRTGKWRGDPEVAGQRSEFEADNRSIEDENFEVKIAHADDGLRKLMLDCCAVDGDVRMRLEKLTENAKAFENESLIEEQRTAIIKRIEDVELRLNEQRDSLIADLRRYLDGVGEITGEYYSVDSDDSDDNDESAEPAGAEDFRDLHGLTDDDAVEDVVEDDFASVGGCFNADDEEDDTVEDADEDVTEETADDAVETEDASGDFEESESESDDTYGDKVSEYYGA